MRGTLPADETERFDYLTRESIMRLWSDDEVAAVSTAQTAAHLDHGDEYVDLESLREASTPVTERLQRWAAFCRRRPSATRRG